jgi:beta-lactam-binding protein with PASTA domain
VTINVAQGPVQTSVPNVISQPIDQAASTLEASGFKVATTFVDSDQPANTIVDQSPPPGQAIGKGSVVTLTVSKGPSTSTIPDVTSLDVASAVSTLQNSGFKSRIVYEDVADPSLDGTVLSQTPDGNTEAKPGSVVALTIGRTSSQTTDTTTTP